MNLVLVTATRSKSKWLLSQSVKKIQLNLLQLQFVRFVNQLSAKELERNFDSNSVSFDASDFSPNKLYLGILIYQVLIAQ